MGDKSKRKRWMTHENEGGIEVLVVLLDVVRIILHHLLLVHGIEIEAGIVVLYGK